VAGGVVDGRFSVKLSPERTMMVRTTTMGVRTMLCSLGEPGEINQEGIAFAMVDQFGRRIVCLVLYGVLSYLDRAPNPVSVRALESFNRHRGRIERWVAERFAKTQFAAIRIEMG
jgi:Protein of unknown function (DUF1488)